MSKIKIFIIIWFVILLLIGGVFGFLYIQSSTRLSIEYIGGDKYLDEILKPEDFKVIDTKTDKEINSKNIKVSPTPLTKDGSKIEISCIIDGKEYTGNVDVEPTLVIKEIKAEFIPENKHIGSKIEKTDFKVIGINNKDEKVDITNFELSSTTLDSSKNKITITYKRSIGDITCDVTIDVTANYIVGAEAKYTGPKLFVGEKVDSKEFEVYYVWHDETKTKADEFKVLDSVLKQPESYIRVSIVDAQGKEYHTDTKIEAKNYATEIHSVLYNGEEQTIGNTIEEKDFSVYAKYSDGSRAKIDDFTIDSEKVLDELENKITISHKNEKGQTINSSITIRAEYNIIYIGDSRITQLKKYTNSKDYNKRDDVEKIYYISNNTADLKWLKNTGIKELNSILEKNPYTKYKIVFNLGLHDLKNANEYIEYYKKLCNGKLENHNVYICSLNPVDETQMEKKNKYSRNKINSVKINEFNDKMNENVLNANVKNLNYLNTYGELKNNSFKTIDGVNYTQETMDVFHELIKELTK